MRSDVRGQRSEDRGNKTAGRLQLTAPRQAPRDCARDRRAAKNSAIRDLQSTLCPMPHALYSALAFCLRSL